MEPNQKIPLEHPEQPLNQPAIQASPVVEPLQHNAGDSLPPVATATPETHDYAHPIIDTPKKAHNPKRLMLGLGIAVGICILAVGAMLAFALLQGTDKKTTTLPTKPTDTKPVASISAKQAIEHTKEYFKGTATAKSSLTLPVRATGRDFYTIIPDIKPLSSVAGEVAPDKAEAQLKSIVHSLEGDDFKKRVIALGAGNTNYLADFSRPETFCEVAVTKPEDIKANQWFEVRCLDMATYSEYATAQDPLVSLYTPLTTTTVQYGFVGKPAPKKSQVAGYSTTELQVSIIVDNHTTSTGKYALYYQTPSGLSYYFRDRDTTQAFDCDEYKGTDILNAYAGVSCRNTSKGTVEVVEAPKKKT